jgi:uncharacterized UPF0160 family protein
MKIVTHNGVFHADEVLAIATLLVFNNKTLFDCEIIRTRDESVIVEAQNDSDVWVIDVGMIKEFSKKNFDHHQNKDLFASNLLVFDYLYTNGVISNALMSELYPFYKGVSNYDTNNDSIIQKYAAFDTVGEYRLFTHIISGFNRSPMSPEQDEQFLQAVNFAVSILENEIYSANERIKANVTWENRQELGDGKVLSFDEFCPIWKEKAKGSNVLCSVMETGGKFGITSIDSDVWTLPDGDTIKSLMSDPDQFIFVHASGFTAGFKTQEAAIEVALQLV